MAVASQRDPHSRLVFWLKILLPIAAIMILSMLFMVSGNIRPEDAIPYAEVDVATRIKEPRLTAPDFAGMTADGAALSLTAGEARVGNDTGPNAGLITDLSGLLETPDGASTRLTAKTARVDQASRTAILGGSVVISNSAGYHIETEGVRVALDRTSLDSEGQITATGPVGRITAGSMHLGLSGPGATDYVLLFKAGVQMIYLPGKQGAQN